MTLPDMFIDHDKPEVMYDLAGLGANGIVATALAALGKDDPGPGSRAGVRGNGSPGRRAKKKKKTRGAAP